MIWDIIEESTFDDHFKNESLELQELLIDENILTEMKNLNPTLLRYLQENMDKVMDKLITYTTTMPSEGDGYDRCYKLPYISSQMLAIDNQLFYCAFLGKIQHDIQISKSAGFHFTYLQKLFSFLQHPETRDNELLMGYFQKVTNNLHKGRKLQFSRAVIDHSELFLQNLDKEAIGSILVKCLVLIDTDEGVLLKERIFLLQKIAIQLQTIACSKEVQLRDVRKYKVGSSILVQTIGKFKTYSSGEELVNSLFISQENKASHIANLVRVPEDKNNLELLKESYNFMIGVLTATKQKIYDPKTDAYEFIFKYPKNIESKLSELVFKELSCCQELEKEQSSKPIKFQNKQTVKPISVLVFKFFSLISVLLQNEISVFGYGNKESTQKILTFAFEVFQKHPKNDVLLVNIDKIIKYFISKCLIDKQFVADWSIYKSMTQVYSTSSALCRPHLFQMWDALRQSNLLQHNKIGQQILNSENWKKMNSEFQNLKKLYSEKVAATQMERPKDAKIIIDQQDIIPKTEAQVHQKMSKSGHSHVSTDCAHEKHESQEAKLSQKIQKFDPFADFSAMTTGNQENKKQNVSQQKKQVKVDFSDFMNF